MGKDEQLFKCQNKQLKGEETTGMTHLLYTIYIFILQVVKYISFAVMHIIMLILRKYFICFCVLGTFMQISRKWKRLSKEEWRNTSMKLLKQIRKLTN